MQVTSFIAESVPEAVEKIRAELGPEAVVLNVRKVEAGGMARLWQKPRLEVLACRQENAAAAISGSVTDELACLRKELSTLKQHFHLDETTSSLKPGEEPAEAPARASNVLAATYRTFGAGKVTVANPRGLGLEAKQWRVEGLLENTGLLPLQAKRVVDMVQARHGETPPPSMAEELALTRQALTQLWRRPPQLLGDSIRPHILVGPAGVGKTTALCKWLTQAVLLEGRAPRVWRLDGACANNAEFLSVHGEILGLETARVWQAPEDLTSAEMNFIDLPGVDWQNPMAVSALREQLQRYRSPQLHLVLNAAYDVPVLLAQLRAFESLPIADLIFTHLDEEPRWGKLWNFILGTNYVVRFLSAGQNIPGHFEEATAEKLLNRLFP